MNLRGKENEVRVGGNHLMRSSWSFKVMIKGKEVEKFELKRSMIVKVKVFIRVFCRRSLMAFCSFACGEF